jgi:hypothetical protein
MNSVMSGSPLRLERVTVVAATFGLVIAVFLGWHMPDAIAAAYRFAAFACLAPAIGSLMFVLILEMTGGQWGAPLRPFLEAGTNLLPWVWLLTLPLLLLPHAGLPGTAGTQSPPRDLYASRAMLVARSLAYAAIFFGIGRATVWARRRRQMGDEISPRWVGPVGMLLLVFMLHLLAEDWLASLEPGWHSTGFALVWMTGQAVAGFSIAVFCFVVGGRDPADCGQARRPLGIDFGNLLLTAMLVWCYVAFAQLLIIWSGNLPSEISWYLRRSHGGWAVMIVALGIFDFALPFLFLLSRRLKTSPAGLAATSIGLLGAQVSYAAWVILPAFGSASLLSAGLAGAMLVAAGGFFLWRYVAVARRLLEVKR